MLKICIIYCKYDFSGFQKVLYPQKEFKITLSLTSEINYSFQGKVVAQFAHAKMHYCHIITNNIFKTIILYKS